MTWIEEKLKQETRLQKIRAQEESRKLEIRERQAQAQALAKAYRKAGGGYK